MPEAWNLFFDKLEDIPDKTDNVCMDISFGENQYGIYTQLICVEVSESTNSIPNGMQKLEIAENTYLHHKHTGSVKEIAQTFGEMYKWAQENNIRAGEFKLDIGYTPTGQDEHHDLYIKVED